ncbi:MAG: FGGY-family carbohydrate kinase, partial [Planctomycetota bacterium]
EPHAGQPRCEVSLASTTQAFDVSKRDWAHGLIERAGLPKHVFPDVVDSGTVLGQYDAAKVIATCSHDTGCAVAATPGQPRDDGYWAFLSSGTWSLLGVEIDGPVVDDRCRELNFTNEQGYRGSTRLLKNISGLYLLQQCRAAWAEAGKAYGYHELAPMADDAPPLVSLIRPECGEFAKPGRMPEKIADYCRRTGQPVPETVGAHVRCIYESLALLYRKTVGELTELTGKSIKTLNIVGGGTQAMLLNQLAADACGIPAVIGPIEATAFGNVLIQAATLGDITPDDIRPIVRRSTSLETCEPKNAETMAAAYDRFVALPTE